MQINLWEAPLVRACPNRPGVAFLQSDLAEQHLIEPLTGAPQRCEGDPRNGLGFMLMNAIALTIVDLIMSLTLPFVIVAIIVNRALLISDRLLHRRI